MGYSQDLIMHAHHRLDS
jgi:hypothetical protein